MRDMNDPPPSPTPASLATLRREYTLAGLTEDAADPDPLRQFEQWFAQARAADVVEPNAMTLATAGPDGQPTARVVLLKGLDGRGFVFFTNYASRKGRELAANPRASLLVFWGELERQVRIDGTVERVTGDESDVYFRQRPRGAQLGAWASAQSDVIASRGELEARVAEVAGRFEGATDVPRPPHWGGYRLVPHAVEFWQGRPNRLHDRLLYTRAAAVWTRQRLSP